MLPSLLAAISTVGDEEEGVVTMDAALDVTESLTDGDEDEKGVTVDAALDAAETVTVDGFRHVVALPDVHDVPLATSWDIDSMVLDPLKVLSSAVLAADVLLSPVHQGDSSPPRTDYDLERAQSAHGPGRLAAAHFELAA